MIGGVAVLGVVTDSVASWMVQTVAEETQAELDAAEAPVQQELRQLSAQVEHLTASLEALGVPDPEPRKAPVPGPEQGL